MQTQSETSENILKEAEKYHLVHMISQYMGKAITLTKEDKPEIALEVIQSLEVQFRKKILENRKHFEREIEK